jgi:S-formylglutathione hydrolase FrmB
MLRPFYLLLLVFACLPVWSQDEPAAAPEAPIATETEVEVIIQSIDVPGIEQDLRIAEFEALSIGRVTKYMIFVPDGYDEQPDRRYPVLYLLHGFTQNYTVWPMMGVADYLNTYKDMIIVMPDVGNSWYINWSESFDDELNNWEDFIIYDLIHNVDQTFRTVPTREGRAISGLSMGGYGAVVLGLRHPDKFCSIASHSGALGYARNARISLEAGNEPVKTVAPAPSGDPREENVAPLIVIPNFTKQHERYPNAIAFNTVDECNQYDPFFLIDNIPAKLLPHIYLDCGQQDNLITINREFALKLMNMDIPFTFGQSPGEHRPSYWGREVAQSLGVQYSVVERNLRYLEYRLRQEAEQAAAAEASAAGGEHDHSQHDHSSTQTPPEPDEVIIIDPR